MELIQSPRNVEPDVGGWRQVLSLDELGIGPEILLRLDALGVRSINDLPRLAALSFEEPLVVDPQTAGSGAETLVRRLAQELYEVFVIQEPCHLILGVEESHTHVAYSFGLNSSTLQVTVSTRLLPKDVEGYLDGLPAPSDRSTVAAARRSSVVDPFADLESAAREVSEGGRLSKVIDLRFGLTDGQRKRTLAEVGALFGVTRERARQDEAKSLRLLNTPRIRRSLRRLTQLVAGVSESLEASPDDPLVETCLLDRFPAAPRPLMPWLRLLAAINADRWAHLRRPVVHGVDAAVADVLAAKVQLSFTDLVGEVANRLGTSDSQGLRARIRASRLFSMEGDVVRLGEVADPDRTSRRVRRLGAMKEVLGSEGPMHFAELAAKIRPLLDPDDSMNLRNVHAWLDRFREYFVWVGPGTYRLRAEGDGRLEREALPERYAPSRRRGVGDAVVALLLERQPRSLTELESHVMPRFVVNRSSIEASILQDRARRFVMTDEKLVYLSDADIASFEASRPRLAGVMNWNELAADLGDWAEAILGDGPDPQPGTK